MRLSEGAVEVASAALLYCDFDLMFRSGLAICVEVASAASWVLREDDSGEVVSVRGVEVASAALQHLRVHCDIDECQGTSNSNECGMWVTQALKTATDRMMRPYPFE